jgi:hypothetical protein
VIRTYSEERDDGEQKALRFLDPRARIPEHLRGRTAALIDSGVGNRQYERIDSMDMTGGASRWVYLEVKNAGGPSSRRYWPRNSSSRVRLRM